MISVIIPALNEQEHIGGCLCSLLGQTVARDTYEIIVVDGGLPEVAVQKSHLREIFLCKNILAHRQGETPCIGPGCLRSIHFG
jgi:glycosyltransferase involved in cell wall biosynthesis